MTAPSTASEEAATFDEYDAIAEALQPYLDCARTGHGEALRLAWLEHVHVVGSMDGSPVDLGLDEFCQAVTDLGGSPDVRSRIVMIDHSGHAACAKLEFLGWASFRFTDYLVLTKQDGSWRVSGKTFDAHSRK